MEDYYLIIALPACLYIVVRFGIILLDDWYEDIDQYFGGDE